MSKKYYKLVRDHIPEIINSSGKRCLTEVLSNEEYLIMLEKKLDEELAEYHNEHNLEELADLLEVVYAITEAFGYTINELENLRLKKLEERGGFRNRILLKEVYNK